MRSKNYAATLFAFIAILTIFTFSLSASTLSTDDPNAANNPSATNGTISFDITDTPTAVDSRLLGTNSPAWINPTKFGNSTFRARAIATGMTLNRFPGGSWSNAYDWLACERNGQGIDDDAVCWWTWAGRPTDFIDFAQSTGGEVMYTINQSGTSKEAAALVAFFNGSVNDHTTIGVDVRGRDWGKVSDWAQLRSDNGNPDPLYVKYWEIGNETYGGNSGTDCFSWGWENDVWTCDGTEYVNGIGSGVNEKEGFIKFRNEMRAVDSSIMVGAVGVTPQSGWTNWGNEVIAAAGDAMDFYIIHQYAFWSQPTNYQEALAQPQSAWQPIMIDVEAAFDQYADGRRVPIAITEHNLFSFQDNDNSQWMKRAVNMLFMADSIGQMMEHGFAMANQW
ncbi:MAG: alpha-L-arabinofuranosidase, partial [Chloroflexi bacterium]|nr:alpha-L-arabinofuranosidase [Chloroflexota bacterium]